MISVGYALPLVFDSIMSMTSIIKSCFIARCSVRGFLCTWCSTDITRWSSLTAVRFTRTGKSRLFTLGSFVRNAVTSSRIAGILSRSKKSSLTKDDYASDGRALMTLAPMKYPLGTVTGMVSLGISVV